MEIGVMDELRVCQEESDLLKQKLHVHLDRWSLDKIIFEEMTAKAERQLHLKDAERSCERARNDLRLGSKQQQLLLLKLKLDSANEDMELKEVEISALKSALQEERKWQLSMTEKLQGMKASFSKKMASEISKLSMDAERKVHHLQNLLDGTVRTHKAEVEQIKNKHALSVTQLKAEIKRLISLNDDMKAQESQWSVEKKQLQELARERDELRAEQEQWHKDRTEICTLLQLRDSLRDELDKRDLKEIAMQAVMDERDGLIAEKDRFISRELEIENLLKERDKLNAQLEHWILRGEDIQNLVEERNKLKHELDVSNAQRQEEVRALVRERDFVWSQMKNLDEDYANRSKRLLEQNLHDRQEIERLRNDLKGAQMSNSEVTVEMTILKLEVKRVEDLAMESQRAMEAKLQELQSRLAKAKEEKLTLVADAEKRELRLFELTSRMEDWQGPTEKQRSLETELEEFKSRLEKVTEEKQTLIADAENRESRLLDLASRTETLERQLDCSDQDPGAGHDGVKEGPEVLNAGDGLILDHEILESQIEQATQVHRNEQKTSTKSVEDLRRENENLRREVENIRILYAELENTLCKNHKKPAKMARKANQRDPTSRNLKLELEAAATCCPSDESPITDGNCSKKGRKRYPGKLNLPSRTKWTQKTSKGASSKSGPEDSHSSEHEEVCKRKTRSSKEMLASNKNPSAQNTIIPSPKQLRRRSRVNYSESEIPALDSALDESDKKRVKKGSKPGDKGDSVSTKSQRPPLHALPDNQRSSGKSAIRTSSSSKCPLPESGKDSFIGSPTKTSKMMANLFSAAFSVPKLKNVQTPSHLVT